MSKFWEALEYILALVGGAVAVYFKAYMLLYVLVGAAALLDLATGMIAAILDGTGLDSKVARKGLLKKTVLLLAVALGTFLDILLPFVAQRAGIHLDETLIFSSIVCGYICVTESISIIENIYRATGGAIPKWIMSMLKKYKEDMEKGGGNNDDRQDT
jgi:toxin secretion/phage lysis holin